jgi:hypothetical protein
MGETNFLSRRGEGAGELGFCGWVGVRLRRSPSRWGIGGGGVMVVRVGLARPQLVASNAGLLFPHLFGARCVVAGCFLWPLVETFTLKNLPFFDIQSNNSGSSWVFW